MVLEGVVQGFTSSLISSYIKAEFQIRFTIHEVS